MEDYIKHPNVSKVTVKLFKEILKLPRHKQEILLMHIRDLEDERRIYSREAYVASVDYSDDNRAMDGYIRNISAGGMFISSGPSLPKGERLTLTFPHPNGEEHMRLNGDVVWQNSEGMGVRFKNEVSSLMTH